MKALLLLSLVFLSACAAPNRHLSSDERLGWTSLSGVDVATVAGELTVVRADPRVTPLELLNPPESAGSLSAIAARSRYAVLTNAAMFAADYATSIGYMRNFDHVNNPHVSSRLKGWLLFHPKKAGLPAVKIGTREESALYDSAFQTHRVWTPQEGILWKPGSVYQQMALVGVDEHARVLLFYHPGFLDVAELAAKILELDLHLTGLLYLDGGHHGALYLAPELGRGWNTAIELPNLLAIRAN